MSEIRISVIVPVYNAENYLKKCIDSILNQTEKSIELILVNDGSLDRSGLICDEYEKLDNRVIVIHQDNVGVSVARNAGMKIAKGDYIGFVDSDDWILPEMYERLLNIAEQDNSDVVMCDATTVYSNGKTETDTIGKLDKSQSIYNDYFKPELLLEMAGAVWRCIYRKTLVKDKEICFPIGVKFSEDRIFNLHAMGYANKVSYFKESYYMRFINIDSAVHRFHIDYFESVKISARETKIAIKNAWNNDEGIQNAYLSQFIGGSLAAINNYFYKTSPLSWMERMQAVKRLCEDIELCDAIKKTGFGGIRGKWILNRKVLKLSICAKILNWKHGR